MSAPHRDQRRSTPRVHRCAVLLGCTGAALMLGVVASAAGRAPSFGGPKNYKAGRHPLAVAIGDLNGDRIRDLAVASYGTSTLSLLLNRGDGSFRAGRAVAVGVHSSSVATGDLNSDGKLDLALATVGTDREPGTTVSVLLNKGGGSFAQKHDFHTGPGPTSVAVGDVNGDGNVDLATANLFGESGTVSVLLNTGDGTFAPAREYGTAGQALEVALGDLNGDRKPDLAVADGGGVSVLLNSGDGSFAPARHYGHGATGVSVAIGDVNGDGKPDLTSGSIDVGVSVLANKGDGTFTSKGSYEVLGAAYSVAIADLNGDRHNDITATDSLGRGPDDSCDRDDGVTVSIFANRGNGRFAAERGFDTGCDPVSVAIGNLNRDRRPDIVTANNGSNNVSVLVNAIGRCVVPRVYYLRVSVAERAIVLGGCRVGTIRRVYSRNVPRGAVISATPKTGTILRRGGKVDLVVSRGRRR